MKKRMKKILLFLLLIWMMYEVVLEQWFTKIKVHAKTIKIGLLLCLFCMIAFLPSTVLKDQMRKIIDIWKIIGDREKTTPKIQEDVKSSFSSSSSKRNVSGYMKKWVASHQNWKCKKCDNTLEASYEVDHILSLEQGGTNHESNLMALCRKCHGLKTFRDRLHLEKKY